MLYENRYRSYNAAIACIDILGSKNMINEDPERYLNIVHNAYDNVILEYAAFIEGKFEMPQIKIFSDNVVLAVPVEDKEMHKLAQLILAAVAFQLSFLSEGLLIRGGITYGNFFLDSVMLSGLGYLKAYEIESREAEFPRIVVDSKFALAFKDSMPDNMSELIKEDDDGKYFIDFLLKSFFKEEKQRENLINNFKRIIKEKMKDKDNERNIEKLKWFDEYLKKQ